MSIWLNYTHIELGDSRRILPSYLFLLDPKFRPVNLQSPEIKNELLEEISNGNLKRTLEIPRQMDLFDDPLIWQILIASYPYEVELKYLHAQIDNDNSRNKKIIALFEQFFVINYDKILRDYCSECDRAQMFQTAMATQECFYSSQADATKKFITYISSLLRNQWFIEEAEAYENYANTKLHISSEEGISGATSEIGDVVMITIGNNTCTTLFHELAHFTNRFFRFHYYQNYDVCFDNYTKTNEWFADFVAYHLHQQIMAGDIEAIETMNTDPLYFSAYIDVYATLREKWSNDRKHNFEIVRHEMKRFGGDLIDDATAHFYFERFYKFFHYDQHEYFYPKEMMYYLGYEEIRKFFVHASDKKQLLTQLFLGRICV